MLRLKVFLGPVFTLTEDYPVKIAGEILHVIKAGTKIYFAGHDYNCNEYIYSC